MKGWLVFLTAVVSHASFFHRHFEIGDEIPVNTQNVAPFNNPFNNPSEKYAYHKLPWPCNTQLIGYGTHHLGSLYQLRFRQSTTKQTLCGEKQLTSQQINQFIDAIDEYFQYEMLVDDLPLYGAVGFKHKMNSNGDELHFLVTHRHFHIKYNNDQIITVNVSTRLQPDHYVEIKRDTALDKIQMTYSAEWSSTKILYQDRYEAQMHFTPTRHELEAHWLWILNSSLLVILLTGLLTMILLRTLKNDVSRYLQIDEMDHDDMVNYRSLNDMDEFGWKRLKFDVFRPPKYVYLFSAIIGIGSQILIITFFLLILAIIGYFYPSNHGSIYVSSFVLYLFTSYISGYVSSSKLKELLLANHDDDKHDWMINWCLVSVIFAVPVFVIFLIINCIASYYNSNVALPLMSIVAVTLLWSFITLPSTAFGSFRGSKCKIEPYPCAIKKIKRPLPSKYAWYMNGFSLFLISGCLPFLSIYVELYAIFMSVFGYSHKPYTLFGILLLTFLILLIVTSAITILITYFQLNSENYNWYWSSLIRASSCGIFIMFYSIYFWHTQTKFNGMLQNCMYFGYAFCISYSTALMLALIGHSSSRWFIIKIYTAIKPE